MSTGRSKRPTGKTTQEHIFTLDAFFEALDADQVREFTLRKIYHPNFKPINKERGILAIQTLNNPEKMILEWTSYRNYNQQAQKTHTFVFQNRDSNDTEKEPISQLDGVYIESFMSNETENNIIYENQAAWRNAWGTFMVAAAVPVLFELYKNFWNRNSEIKSIYSSIVETNQFINTVLTDHNSVGLNTPELTNFVIFLIPICLPFAAQIFGRQKAESYANVIVEAIITRTIDNILRMAGGSGLPVTQTLLITAATSLGLWRAIFEGIVEIVIPAQSRQGAHQQCIGVQHTGAGSESSEQTTWLNLWQYAGLATSAAFFLVNGTLPSSGVLAWMLTSKIGTLWSFFTVAGESDNLKKALKKAGIDEKIISAFFGPNMTTYGIPAFLALYAGYKFDFYTPRDVFSTFKWLFSRGKGKERQRRRLREDQDKESPEGGDESPEIVAKINSEKEKALKEKKRLHYYEDTLLLLLLFNSENEKEFLREFGILLKENEKESATKDATDKKLVLQETPYSDVRRWSFVGEYIASLYPLDGLDEKIKIIEKLDKRYRQIRLQFRKNSTADRWNEIRFDTKPLYWQNEYYETVIPTGVQEKTVTFYKQMVI